MKVFVFVSLLLAAFAVSSNAQFPQAQRARERMQQASQPPDPNKKPVYKPKTNVDVSMVLAKKDVASFALAQPLAAAKIADGDPLWLYIRFKDELGKYVYRTHGEGGDRYLLALELGKPGIMGTAMHYILSFTEPELKQKELKIALTSGLWGRNSSLPIFLRSVADPERKVAATDLSLTGVFGFPKSNTDDLARITISAADPKGSPLYEKMLADYKKDVIRGSKADVLPKEGTFDDAGIRARLFATLAESGIKPSRLYFAADDWVEFSDQPMRVMEKRTMDAVFIYDRDGGCFYGTVEITQPYDPMLRSYGASTFKIEHEVARPCELK
ncbi:MAG TPA: hypothetical protein PLR83_00785 [Pyrinomonadaceae bacterium]|nr:hypothetical protein [Pyrinomonadaceae bacterium]